MPLIVANDEHTEEQDREKYSNGEDRNPEFFNSNLFVGHSTMQLMLEYLRIGIAYPIYKQ